MSTRGALGFRLLERDIITYNDADSYPDYLGNVTLEYLAGLRRDNDYEAMLAYLKLHVAKLVPVDTEQSYPEGDIPALFKAGRYEDRRDFLFDALFCEYAYIINLDEETLEFYRGDRHQGRYAEELRAPDQAHHPVGLAFTIALKTITPETVNANVAKMNKACT